MSVIINSPFNISSSVGVGFLKSSYEEVRINFSQNSATISGVNNAFGIPSNAIVTVNNLTDRLGKVTPFSVTSIATVNWSPYSNGASSDDTAKGITGGSYLSSLTPTLPVSMYQSIWFQHASSSTQPPASYDATKPQLRISGLNPSRTYTIKLTGSEGNLTFTNELRVRMVGATSPTSQDYSGQNITSLDGGVTFTLAPDSSGKIDIWMNIITGSGGAGAVCCVCGITIIEN
jgi:hypothetical protein